MAAAPPDSGGTLTAAQARILSSLDTVAAPTRLTRAELLLALFLAGTSGLGVMAHAFGPVPMSFSAPFVVLPAGILLAGAILLKRGLPERLHAFSSALLRGALWGLVATLAYDAIRPGLVELFGFHFNPYRAIYFFGELITDRPRTETVSWLSGWGYHFWNGISFGMIFAILRPKGGVVHGFLWAETLQVLMMITYPSFLQVRLDNPGFLATGLIGHGIWGIILGWGMQRTYRGP
jgi:hypothetical protein